MVETGIAEATLHKIATIIIFRQENGIDDAVHNYYCFGLVWFLSFIVFWRVFVYLSSSCTGNVTITGFYFMVAAV